jgi:type VI secretion system protein ImpL
MSEGLKELILDVDGQPLRFVAGNPASSVITWPSQKVSSHIRLSAVPAGTTVNFEGPWAFFRFIDRFEMQPTSQPERFALVVNIDGKRAKLEVIANSVLNPFRMREIQQFRCPGSL